MVDRAISVSAHKELNTMKGVIECSYVRGVPEEEIKMELKSQGVTEVCRTMFRKGSVKVPTNTLFLTFCTPALPHSIKVGCLNVKMTLYIPSPIRCFKCQNFGHVRDQCSEAEVCGMCSKAVHEGMCDGPALCTNCGGNHPSFSGDCPTWRVKQEILKVKTENKIPFFEARKIVQARCPPPSPLSQSYSAAVKKVPVALGLCQTDISCFTEKGQHQLNSMTSQERTSAHGRGIKSATSQTVQQSKTPTDGQSGKPALPPRPSESRKQTVPPRVSKSSAHAGRGTPKAVLVEMKEGPLPTPTKQKSSLPAGKQASRTGDCLNKAELELQNQYAPLQMEEDDRETD